MGKCFEITGFPGADSIGPIRNGNPQIRLFLPILLDSIGPIRNGNHKTVLLCHTSKIQSDRYGMETPVIPTVQVGSSDSIGPIRNGNLMSIPL